MGLQAPTGVEGATGRRPPGSGLRSHTLQSRKKSGSAGKCVQGQSRPHGGCWEILGLGQASGGSVGGGVCKGRSGMGWGSLLPGCQEVGDVFCRCQSALHNKQQLTHSPITLSFCGMHIHTHTEAPHRLQSDVQKKTKQNHNLSWQKQFPSQAHGGKLHFILSK